MIDAATTSTGGLLAAGAAAVLWAGATMLYGRAAERVGPATLNLVKGLVATALFAATLLLLGRPIVAPLANHGVAASMLALSGIVGIAVGDTAYFAAIGHVGPRQTSLLSLLAAPLTAVGGLVFLDERLPAAGWAGVGVTVAGIAWVVAERRRLPLPEPAADNPATAFSPKPHQNESVARGIAFGVAAALCQTVGQLVNRGTIRGDTFDPLWTAAWRLLAAVAVLAVFLPLLRRARRQPRLRRTAGPFWRFLLPAMLMGTYGGIWLQQFAVANAEAGYAQTLLSTSPVWILPMAALSGERISPRAVVGSLVAIAGVVMLVWSSR